MNKKQVLAEINKLITVEMGSPVGMDNLFTDANMESLSTVIVLATLDSKFSIFNSENITDELLKIHLKGLSIRDLITRCLLPT